MSELLEAALNLLDVNRVRSHRNNAPEYSFSSSETRVHYTTSRCDEADLSASEPGVILTVLGPDHHVNPVEQGLSGQYLECSSSIHPFRDTE